MSEVIADSFPVFRSSCIIREFAATHEDRVICSNFGFPFAARRTTFAPLALFPISCSSSLLSYVSTLTRSGINKGFSPLLVPAFCWRPRNTCGSLSSRDRLARLTEVDRSEGQDRVLNWVSRSPQSSLGFPQGRHLSPGIWPSLECFVACCFWNVDSKPLFWSTRSPKASVSFEVRSFKASFSYYQDPVFIIRSQLN